MYLKIECTQCCKWNNACNDQFGQIVVIKDVIIIHPYSRWSYVHLVFNINNGFIRFFINTVIKIGLLKFVIRLVIGRYNEFGSVVPYPPPPYQSIVLKNSFLKQWIDKSRVRCKVFEVEDNPFAGVDYCYFCLNPPLKGFYLASNFLYRTYLKY